MARSSSSRSCSRVTGEGGPGGHPLGAPSSLWHPYLAFMLLLDHLLLSCLLICLDCGEGRTLREALKAHVAPGVEAEPQLLGKGRASPGPGCREAPGRAGGGGGTYTACSVPSAFSASASPAASAWAGEGGEEAGDRVGVLELPQATTSKSLGLAGSVWRTGRLWRPAVRVWEPRWTVEGRWGTDRNPGGWISRPTRAPLQAHRAQLSGTAAGGN